LSSEIFDSLLRERIDVFRAAFSSTATEVFYNPDLKKLRHAGEYGMYRESIVRDFLKFIIPNSLEISNGFIITSMNDVSTQCDIVIFDSKMTPLYQEGDRQRFFPVESVFCVGEVKSTLSKTNFKSALNKLAKTKALSERVTNPYVLRRHRPGEFNPINEPYDLISSILICQKLDFDLSNIENEIDGFYEDGTQNRHKHNMILSVEDGLICYFHNDKSRGKLMMPYPRLIRVNLKNRFMYPDGNRHVHFKLFSMYMFMINNNKTLLYPDLVDYISISSIDGGYSRDQF
jgi:hypothetical protein